MSALKILFTKQHIDVFGRCAKWLAKQGVRSQQHADGAYGEKSKMLNLQKCSTYMRAWYVLKTAL